MRSKLDVAANIAIITLCLVATVTWTRHHAAIQSASGVSVGDRIVALQSDEAEPRLMIALATDCRFCADSVPFYESLASRERQRRLVVAVASSEEKERVEAMARESGIAFDEIVELDFQEIGLVATPTLLLIDPRGKVLERWVGKLGRDDQLQVIRALTS